MTERLTSYSLAAWQRYYSDKEVDALHNLAAMLPPDAIVVKIGAGAGTDTLCILETTEAVVIFSIDILAGESLETTNEHLRLPEAGYGDTGHVIRIWGDSKVVCKRWPLQVDILIIDGDHFAAGVRGDILGWEHYLKPGGIIVFHDYGSPDWSDVEPAVSELIGKRDDYALLFHVDTLIAFRKIGE